MYHSGRSGRRRDNVEGGEEEDGVASDDVEVTVVDDGGDVLQRDGGGGGRDAGDGLDHVAQVAGCLGCESTGWVVLAG